MAIFYNEEGDEVSAFIQDEVDALIQKEKENLEVEHNKKVQELETKLKNIENGLNDDILLKDKNYNFKNLREVKDALTKELEEKKNEWETKFAQLTNELSLKDLKNSALEMARGDSELAKEIEKNYFVFAKPKDGEQDDRLEKAYKLATFDKKPEDKKIPNFITFRNGGLPPRGGNGQLKEGELTPEQKELGKKMGLSDTDLK